MKKLFINAPSFILFIGLMILCWVHVEYAPTKFSYQATDYADELNPIAETQINSAESQLLFFTGNHSTPLTEGEDSEDLDETEGKHLALTSQVFSVTEYFLLPLIASECTTYPEYARNKPLYVLFHSWKNHLTA